MERRYLNKNKLFIAALVLASAFTCFLVYIFLLPTQLPFRSDEAERSLTSLILARYLKTGEWFSFLSLSYSLSYHPFIYFWLTTISFLISGESFEAARMVSLFFFFLTPVIIYLIAREISEKNAYLVGAVAAFLWLTSPVLLIYSSLAMMEIAGVKWHTKIRV